MTVQARWLIMKKAQCSRKTGLHSLSKEPYIRSPNSLIFAFERALHSLSKEPIPRQFEQNRAKSLIMKKDKYSHHTALYSTHIANNPILTFERALYSLSKEPYIRSRKSPIFALQIALYPLLKEPYVPSPESQSFDSSSKIAHRDSPKRALYSLSKKPYIRSQKSPIFALEKDSYLLVKEPVF